MANSTPTSEATIEREIDATPASVWQALTTNEGFSLWSGEGSNIDPVPGGAVFTPDDPTGQERVGAVEKVDTDRHLRYRWWPSEDPDLVSTVDIDLYPVCTGTRVVVTERLVLPRPTPKFGPSCFARVTALAKSFASVGAR